MKSPIDAAIEYVRHHIDKDLKFEIEEAGIDDLPKPYYLFELTIDDKFTFIAVADIYRCYRVTEFGVWQSAVRTQFIFKNIPPVEWEPEEMEFTEEAFKEAFNEGSFSIPK